MNLTTDPWIPVIGADGRQRSVSLHDLFISAQEIRDLSVKPHEKIALLRLLICITQAALDGPKDYDAWETCRAAIQPAVKHYLDKWAASFELFGDGPRFLQALGLKTDKDANDQTWATKLDFMLSSGNNASLFDNAAGLPRSVESGRLALTLLAFQCFAPCSLIGSANWAGVEIPKCTAKHAPCTPSCMLHAYLIGESILETLHLNLMNKEDWKDLPGEGWGKPVWEHFPTAPNDVHARTNTTMTYLGRLVPMSRLAVLEADGRSVSLANGFDYPLAPAFREPAVTMIPRKEGVGVLGADVNKSIWRQLLAVTLKRQAKADVISGPIALRNHSGEEAVTLWIAALVTVGNNKIEDVVEAAYDIPAGMFRDAGRKLYEEGIALASSWQEAVSKSVKAYAGTLKLEPVPYDRARHHFWTVVEQHVPTLLKLTDKPEEAGDLKASEWGRRVKEAAHASFDFACSRQTPRQIQAYAIGLQQLFLPKPKDPNAPAKKKASTKKTS